MQANVDATLTDVTAVTKGPANTAARPNLVPEMAEPPAATMAKHDTADPPAATLADPPASASSPAVLVAELPPALRGKPEATNKVTKHITATEPPAAVTSSSATVRETKLSQP